MATPKTGNRRGAPRKPTALALLHGDDKKNPARVNRNEPKPVGEVVRPDGLSDGAAELWDQLAPAMVRARMVVVTDVPLFVEFCEALALARAARVRAMQEASGELVTAPGAPSPSNIWARAMAVANSLGGKFGLTPSDRAELVIGGSNGGTTSSNDLLTG